MLRTLSPLIHFLRTRVQGLCSKRVNCLFWVIHIRVSFALISLLVVSVERGELHFVLVGGIVAHCGGLHPLISYHLFRISRYRILLKHHIVVSRCFLLFMDDLSWEFIRLKVDGLFLYKDVIFLGRILQPIWCDSGRLLIRYIDMLFIKKNRLH